MAGSPSAGGIETDTARLMVLDLWAFGPLGGSHKGYRLPVFEVSREGTKLSLLAVHHQPGTTNRAHVHINDACGAPSSPPGQSPMPHHPPSQHAHDHSRFSPPVSPFLGRRRRLS
ncbi:hypothetical protein GGTG_02014 [Gaeumannomyces tritici R3-111a-1]|uniref:Uncharacterized protein n=1 Tax=Gaeumannomyces tritici (strain R3-111a-1) TaxID=644352 RepID=J3NL73_GAET3|nr:hypothetical protein GGTG_02014 [Gaeumannomyces tritici R3-111a-1]EJT82040.1 hypothetical protein GGTG_02014 [Gaeumannomyces tritici R3-111a-1]